MLLIQLIIEARLVVLPEPVGPVTRIKPARPLDQLFHHGRQTKLLEGEKLVGNSPEHQAHVAALLENRHAEPGHLAEREPEVGTPHLLKLLLTPLRRDALHERHGVGRLQHLRRQRPHVTVKPQHRLAADGEVKIARLLGADRLQQFVDEQCTHALQSLRPNADGPVMPSPRHPPGPLTFSQKPGVHRFVMPGFRG